MRKLLALFCALGMLVPSVAMAGTFGSTFGETSIIYFDWFWGSASTWPVGTALSVTDLNTSSCWPKYRHASGPESNCEDRQYWSSEFSYVVPKGGILRTLTCSNQAVVNSEGWTTDDTTELEFGLATSYYDTFNNTNFGSRQIGPTLVIPDMGAVNSDARQVGASTSIAINYRFPDGDGRLGLVGLFNPLATPGVGVTRFYWNCTLTVEVPKI